MPKKVGELGGAKALFIKPEHVVVNQSNRAWVKKAALASDHPTGEDDILLYVSSGNPYKTALYLKTIKPWGKVSEVKESDFIPIEEIYLPNHKKPLSRVPAELRTS